MVVIDSAGKIRYANPATGWLVGQAPESLHGLAVLPLIHPDDRRRVRQDLRDVAAGHGHGTPVEYRVRASDGAWKTVLATASNLLDLSAGAGVLVSATDVTAQRAQEQNLRRLALVNPVTGLANRRALRDRLDIELNGDRPLSIAFIDLDHFKQVNDCLGHTVGDAVLSAAGSRLSSLVPKAGMVCHFGADTFVVLTNLTPERAAQLSWELIGLLGHPLFIEGHELRLAATAGLANREAATTSESILRDADAALTRAKSTRRGGVEVFTERMRIEAVERLALETDLRHALERDEFRLFLQPVVHIDSGKAEGSEALIRWHRRNGEQVNPVGFIPLAEETGLILPIGEWVLDAALAALLAGRTRRASVNLSPRQLLDPGLPARVERLLSTKSLDPEQLSFEVTEAVVVENYDLAVHSLNRVRRLGCSVGLDDFGTGYSSLAYLRRLPVDFLKVDRSLIEDVDTDTQAARIAETIVGLARTLSLTTIAEGIERQAQADTLTAMGYHYGQGWLYGHPEPA